MVTYSRGDATCVRAALTGRNRGTTAAICKDSDHHVGAAGMPGSAASSTRTGDIAIRCCCSTSSLVLIAPIIFFTVVHGIASMKDMKKVGRVGLKALIYFEVVTTLALVIGLIVVNLWQPGVGMNVDLSRVDTSSIATYTTKAKDQSTIGFLMEIIPSTVVGAFATGEILQVLFFAILFAFGLQALGSHGEPVLRLIDIVGHIFFRIVGLIMKLAPIGAFGAMAFTIGKYGVGTLLSLGNFMLAFYTTCLLFIFGVLGGIAALCGFSHLQVHQVYQGRVADRPRYLVLGVGAPANDRQDGEPGL